MTLATFVKENIDAILEEWVEFARTLSPQLDLDALRNHAQRMLLAVAADMESEQSDEQQRAKSRGEGRSDADSAAHLHGDQRYSKGFSLEQLISEYRALRATVIRLWLRGTTLDERTIDDLTRFNESIDQLVAESVVNFSKQVDHARALFMGVLGHDLRTDLHVILTCAERLERVPTEHTRKYAPHIKESANNILVMVEDLLDVARTRLGGQLPIEVRAMEASSACEEVLHPFRQLHPSADIRLDVAGDVRGRWDQRRLQQMLSNLIRNALQYGDLARPITLSARRSGENVIFSVHNHGSPIPSHLLDRIFDPLQRGDDRGDKTSLGLGLYIASTIAKAHGGHMTVVTSDTCGTTFAATLPARMEPE